jgi:hypothetical protein
VSQAGSLTMDCVHVVDAIYKKISFRSQSMELSVVEKAFSGSLY